MSAAFVHWTTYFVTTPDTVVQHLPLNLMWGDEPPTVLHRNGISCTRICFDDHRRMVAYAAFGVETDIRTAVQLVQAVHGDQYAEINSTR